MKEKLHKILQRGSCIHSTYKASGTTKHFNKIILTPRDLHSEGK